MKRIAGLAGALVTSAVLAVSVVPGAAADVREPRVPVGVSPSGVVSGAASTGAAARDIPDIEWPPPGHSRETLLEFADAMGKHLDTSYPAVVPEGAQRLGSRTAPCEASVVRRA